MHSFPWTNTVSSNGGVKHGDTGFCTIIISNDIPSNIYIYIYIYSLLLECHYKLYEWYHRRPCTMGQGGDSTVGCTHYFIIISCFVRFISRIQVEINDNFNLHYFFLNFFTTYSQWLNGKEERFDLAYLLSRSNIVN